MNERLDPHHVDLADGDILTTLLFADLWLDTTNVADLSKVAASTEGKLTRRR